MSRSFLPTDEALRALRQHLSQQGADLPAENDLTLTRVMGGLTAALGDVPGADMQARDELGIEPASSVLLIMVDGLGWMPLMEHLGHAPCLRGFREEIRSVHTVVPSTTAAAITACATGALPADTRMVGYSVAHGSSVMNLLAFAPDVDPAQWQSVPTHFQRLGEAGIESAVILPPKFADSGLTRAALRGARHVGAVSWEERCRAAVQQLRAGTPLVYLYWSEVDHAGHGHGVGSEQWLAALEEFDAGLRTLLRSLPPGVRTVLTADHGMCNVDQRDLLDVAHTPDLARGVACVAGETRAVHVHVSAGENPDHVREHWQNTLGERAWILSSEECASVMGRGVGTDSIGSFVAFMRENYGVVDSRVQSEGAIALVGVHGSMTPAEMRIPVIRLS